MNDLTYKPSAILAARWSLAQGVVGVLLQFATLALLARLLTPNVFGIMAILLIVQNVATLFAQMGLSSALIQRSDLSKSALHSLYWLNVVLGVVVTLALYLIAPILGALFSMPELGSTVSVIGLTFFISCWSTQFQALAQKQLRFRRIALINLAGLFVAGVISVLLAWNGLGIWSLVNGLVAASFVRSFSFFAFGIRDNGMPVLHFSWLEARELVIFGANRFGAMLANAVNSRADQMLIGGILGSQALGYYSMASRIALQPTDLTNPVVTRVAFPWFSRIQHDNDKLGRTYLEVIGLVAAVNSPILVATAVLAEWYVPLLLGDGWESTIALIQILAGYALMRSIINAGGSLILAKGHADWTFYWNLFLLVLYPGALYLVIQGGDIRAAAMTLASLQALVLLLYHRALVKPLTDIRLDAYLVAIGRPIFCALAAGIVSYAAIILSGQSSNMLSVVIGLVVGTGVYLGAAYVLIPRQVATIRKILFKERQRRDK